MKKLKWALASVLVVFAFLFGLIGFAHTRSGRPLLPYFQAVFGKPKGCPLGYDKAPSIAQHREFAKVYLAAHAQLKPATAKIVPGFAFGKTTIAELKAFAQANSGTCENLRSELDYECLNVKTAHGVQTLWATFDAHQHLAYLKYVETIPHAEEAAQDYGHLIELLEANVGPPSAKMGTFSESALNSGLLYQATREYFYNNYYSVVRVTNMGQNFAITTEFSDPEVFFKL